MLDNLGYDTYDLYNLIKFKYKESHDISGIDNLFINDDSDFDQDELFEFIQYELESLGILDDLIENHQKYQIEMDERDPYHWRSRVSRFNDFTKNWS